MGYKDPEKQREYQRKWAAKKKLKNPEFALSELERSQKWKEKNSDKVKDAYLKYNQSDKGKVRDAKYKTSDQAKQTRKNRNLKYRDVNNDLAARYRKNNRELLKGKQQARTDSKYGTFANAVKVLRTLRKVIKNELNSR